MDANILLNLIPISPNREEMVLEFRLFELIQRLQENRDSVRTQEVNGLG